MVLARRNPDFLIDKQHFGLKLMALFKMGAESIHYAIIQAQSQDSDDEFAPSTPFLSSVKKKNRFKLKLPSNVSTNLSPK